MVELHAREYDAVMLCGGKGERLAALNPDLPKSLFKVAGKELIRYSTDHMDPDYIKQLVLAVGCGAEEIEAWTHSYNFPQRVAISHQKEPGIVSAIRYGAEHVTKDAFIACNTDEVRHKMDLSGMLQFHESTTSIATMLVTRADRLHRHRLVNANINGLVTRTRLKPQEYVRQPEATGLVNTGFLVIDKEALRYFDSNHSRDWSGIIDPLCEAGKLSAYTDERVKYFNVGTPEEYYEAATYLEQNT